MFVIVRADDLPQLLRREWGFAPLCGAAATPVAALKTPVASEGGWQKGLPLHVAKDTFARQLKKNEFFLVLSSLIRIFVAEILIIMQL